MVANVDENDDLQDGAPSLEDALNWFQREEGQERAEQQFQQAVADLESALDCDSSLDVLESLFELASQTAVQAGLEIDEDLRTRYEQRTETLERAERRRSYRRAMLLFTATLAVFLVVGAGVFYWWYRGQVAAVVAQLSQAMEAGNLDAAQQQLAQLHETSPWLAGAGKVQAQQEALASLLRKEEERRQRFEEAIEAAESAGVETPNHAALTTAKELAKTAQELDRVEAFEANIVAYLKKARLDKEQELRSELAEILQALTDLESEPAAEEVPENVRQLLGRLQQIELRAGDIALSQELDAARRRLQAIRDSFDQSKGMREAESRIIAAVGAEYSRYASALRYYAASFPESPLSADFQVAAEEQPMWEGLEAWNQLADVLERANLPSLSPDRARSLQQQIDQTAGDHPGYPQATDFDRLSPFLEAVGRRTKNDVPAVEDVKQFFTNPVIFGLWMVQTRSGQRYYTPQEPKDHPYAVRVSYFTDYVQRADITIKAQDIELMGRAPQSVLAEEVLRQLTRLGSDTSNWESFFYHLIQAVTAARDVDPILHVTMFQRVLETACNGSYPLQRAFTPHIGMLKAPGFSLNANWMNPSDEDANRSRAQARLLLENLPGAKDGFKEAFEEAARLRLQLMTTKFTRYRWIGWLKRDANLQWSCVHGTLKVDSGNVVIVRESTVGPEVLTIGSNRGGEIRLSGSTAAFVAGRPVYLEMRPAGS
jgi:hypothetical protein